MPDQFYIFFESDELDSFSLKHIQYNIHKRLRGFKYVTYRRLDLVLVEENGSFAAIEWDDRKTAKIRCYAPVSILESITDENSIGVVYDVLFGVLEVLWTNNHWNIEDLKSAHSEIKKEKFFSSRSFGKIETSPDKKHKAEFYCELYPGYADYYFCCLGKGGKIEQKILFLHGHPDPGIFFGYFSNRIWRDNEYFLVSDFNKEIFFIFHVNDGSYSIEYRPLDNSLEVCKNYLAAFQANLSQRERMRLLGLPYH